MGPYPDDAAPVRPRAGMREDAARGDGLRPVPADEARGDRRIDDQRQGVTLRRKGYAQMKLKNVLIVVKDIERSRLFYHDLFGLETILDNDGNMILTEGLVLQEAKYWKEFLGKEIIPENNSCELYFEEADMEDFIYKLERYYPEVKYVNRLMTHSWGQRVIRFYDPDGNLIEVGTPM